MFKKKSTPENIEKKILINRNKGLIELSNALKKLKIPFMLSDGVLLGAVRDGDFIPWDWDVEISIKVEDIFSKSDQVIELLKERGFEIINVILSWENYKINVNKYKSKYSLVGFYKKDGHRLRSAWIYPEILFNRLEKIKFLGNEYLAPSPPDNYLKYQYGDWKTPIREGQKRKYLTTQVFTQRKLVDRIKAYINLKFARSLTQFKIFFRRYYLPRDRECLFQIMYNFCIYNSKKINIIEVGSSDGREASLVLKWISNRIGSINIYEPDKKNFKVLQRNVRKYEKDNKVKLHNVAVGTLTKKEFFYLSGKASNLNSSIPQDKNQKKITIQHISLLEILNKNKNKAPMMIKMDIEGFEVDLLNSVIDYLLNCNDMYILLEVHPIAYSKNRDMNKILDTLFNNGYYPLMLESAGLKEPKLYKDRGMTPIFESKSRALYSYPKKDFTKLVCSKNICDYVNKKFLTHKIARSVLITNSKNKFPQVFNVNDFIH